MLFSELMEVFGWYGLLGLVFVAWAIGLLRAVRRR